VTVSYLERNRAAWAEWSKNFARHAEQLWPQEEITWGQCRVPEAKLNLLGDVTEKDVVELGCGTAYFSSWLARRGARPIGVDLTPSQLETARRMQARHGIEFPLIEANAENVPLPDASFDLAISEYGASIWCDPYRWIPEAARLLRAEGDLVFLRYSTLVVLCLPPEGSASDRLARNQFGLHRVDRVRDSSTEFHLAHGEWIRLLRANGFTVESLVELAPEPGGGESDQRVPVEWARRWPMEEIWKATKVRG
jgi:ubiquinone/menaquinone biosynthesis C-methylase UbiE